jgi:hypothetical protein
MKNAGPAPRRRLEPYIDSRPEPLEILSRLAGSTTYRQPASGGKATITTEDIAHALGKVGNDLAEMLALAIATGNRHQWAAIHSIAYPKLIGQLLADRRTRQLVSGPYRFRARLVMYDAFHDLVLCRQASWREAARVCRMQQRTYRELHYAVTGFLRTEAVEAAHQAMKNLNSLRQ